MSVRGPSPLPARTLVAAGALALCVLVAATAALAARGAPPSVARDLAQIYFANTLTRAEVVSVVGRTVHDYRIDEGKITAIRAGAIDLLERDGTRQTIAVGPQTKVLGAAFARGIRVVAMRDGDGPATLIRPSGSAGALGKTLFAATFVRGEVVTYAARTLHDVRIDEGRIMQVRPGWVVLRERDGTSQTITVGPTTSYTLAGQPVDASSVTRGMWAIAVREGAGPAEELRLFPLGLALGR